MLTKRPILLVFVVAVVVVAVPARAQARNVTSSEASLVNTMNAVRKSRGLVPLRIDSRLTRAARRHSADMLRRQYFAHGAAIARAVHAGARGPLFGETLAWSTGITAQWVVAHWLASPRHRTVLLRPGFRRVGIGIVFGPFIGHGNSGVVTADFAGR